MLIVLCIVYYILIYAYTYAYSDAAAAKPLGFWERRRTKEKVLYVCGRVWRFISVFYARAYIYAYSGELNADDDGVQLPPVMGGRVRTCACAVDEMARVNKRWVRGEKKDERKKRWEKRKQKNLQVNKGSRVPIVITKKILDLQTLIPRPSFWFSPEFLPSCSWTPTLLPN